MELTGETGKIERSADAFQTQTGLHFPRVIECYEPKIGCFLQPMLNPLPMEE